MEAANNLTDVFRISKTNLSRREGQILNRTLLKSLELTGFWSEKEEKIKGSGVAIILKSQWEKHVSKVSYINPYAIQIKMEFKGCTIFVTQVYLPPSDKIASIDTQKEIISHIRDTKHKQEVVYIIMGDFNSIVDKELDRSGNTRFYKKPILLFNLFNNYGFIDTYRAYHPTDQAFTWSNRTIHTRIDHIWISPNLSKELISARIHDAKLITQSDNNIIECLLYTKELIRNHRISQNKQYSNKHHIYHYNKMKEEDWTKYTGNLEKRFKDKAKDIDNTFKLTPSQQNIDKIWKIIKTNISQYANKNIPHTLTSSNKNVTRQRKTELRPSEFGTYFSLEKSKKVNQ
jgi:exonuclease III